LNAPTTHNTTPLQLDLAATDSPGCSCQEASCRNTTVASRTDSLLFAVGRPERNLSGGLAYQLLLTARLSLNMRLLLALLACVLFVAAQNLTDANATEVRNVTEAVTSLTVVPEASRTACFAKFRNCVSRVARQQFSYNHDEDGTIWRYLTDKAATADCKAALHAAKRLDGGRDFEVEPELGLRVLQCIQTVVDNSV
jgi:hypothetical protein